MDLPRRSLSDLSKSLADLLVPRRSLSDLSKSLADSLVPQTNTPSPQDLSELRASRRRNSYWGMESETPLPAKILDMFPVSPPVPSGESTSEGKDGRPHGLALPFIRTLSSVGLYLILSGANAYFDLGFTTTSVLRLALTSTLVLVGLYLCWDILLCFCTWVQVNGRFNAAPHKRTLTPTTLSQWHALLFFVHKLNYAVHIIAGFLYLLRMRCGLTQRLSQSEIADRVVELLLGTSYAIFLKQLDKTGADGRRSIFALNMKDVAVHFTVGKFDNTLDVEVDGSSREVLSFLWNSKTVRDPIQQMTILLDIGGEYIHPMIHSLNGSVYASKDKVDAKYDRMFRHGQNLNEASHVYPALALGTPVKWFKMCLENGGQAGIPVHTHSALAALTPYSAYVRFMLATRRVYFRLLGKYKIDVDAESFFACSALHSVDHHVYCHLEKDVPFPDTRANLAYAWFHWAVASTCNFFMDNTLRGNCKETAFYDELYTVLVRKNRKYADMIDLSISC